MQIAGSNELVEQVLNKDLCSVCGACVALCPYFKAYKGKIAVVFNCDLEQGRCFAHCPKTDTDFDLLAQKYFAQPYNGNALGIYRRIHASKAGEKMEEGIYQNGGTVSALMKQALAGGLIKGAVLTGSNGIVPEPRLVTKADEVVQTSSTKYMAAPTVSCLNQAAADGLKDLGIVGTACQLTGVAQMRTNPLEKDDFTDPVALAIGLFCTWSLETREFLSYLSAMVDIDTITGMDVPPPPAEIFIVRTGDSTIEIPLSEIRTMVPNGCSVCSDMTAEWSDISVGAFEGKSAWNTLIVRSEKGEQLVDQAVKEGYLVLEDFPSSSLDHLILGAGNKKKRAKDTSSKEKK